MIDLSARTGSRAGGGNAAALSVLRRIAKPRQPRRAGETCEMCAEPIADEHPHVVDLSNRGLMCACRGCALLFPTDAAHLRFRTVPDRLLSFEDFRLGSGLWDELGIPVGLALFFHSSAVDRVVAFYPGPAGATESELPLAGWDAVLAANPGLATALPDVEALVVRAPDDHGLAQCFLVPIDQCYELIGRLRQTWRGFDGGQEARSAIEQFFARAAGKAKPARAAEANRA